MRPKGVNIFPVKRLRKGCVKEIERKGGDESGQIERSS